MNKQQLIDKAIDDLGGEYPFPVHAYLHKAGCNYFTCDSQSTGVIDSHYVCSFYEFQDRQAERSVEDYNKVIKVILDAGSEDNRNQHWYDYENQKALRFPPVGEVCILKETAEEIRIVAYDGYNIVFCVCGSHIYDFDQLECIAPTDWNKRSARDEMVQLIESHGNLSAGQLADSIIAAGYRKCDNNTSTTQG